MTSEAEAGQPTAYPTNIIRIEHYQEEDAQAPTAWLRFLGRWQRFKADREVERWASLVNDSVTSQDIAARKHHQYNLNPNAKDPRQWYGGAKDLLEETLYINFGALRCNVMTIAHIDADKDEVSGAFLRLPAAPGKLTTRLPGGYAELWRMYSNKQRERVIQTANDGSFGASTHLDVPDDMVIPKSYGWSWVMEQGGADGPQHVITYGDFGVGKSTLASYAPLPAIVFMWDPVGKDTPYRKRGKVIDSFDEEAAWDASGQPIAWTHVEVVEVSQ